MKRSRLTQIAVDTVGAAQRQLPPEIRPLARNVPVHYEAVPSAELLADGSGSDILGLFAGTVYGPELEELDTTPPQILLYLDNLWDFAGEDVEIFREEVRLTYLHELGHYLGWGEEELEARGLE